jgi:hypothetical protein
MGLSDFNSIISKEVVDDIREIIKAGVESENSAIVIEELLL